MEHAGAIIRGILAVIVFGGIGGYVIVQSVRKADDPARMVFKWILTAVILWILIKKVGDFVNQGGAAGAFIGWWLDRWYGTEPYALLAATLLAVVGGFIRLIQVLRGFERSDREREP